MMCISSPAGRRLAVARAAMDEAWEQVAIKEASSLDPRDPEFLQALLRGRGHIREPAYRATREFDEAARVVANELIAQRFNEMEGD